MSSVYFRYNHKCNKNNCILIFNIGKIWDFFKNIKISVVKYRDTCIYKHGTLLFYNKNLIANSYNDLLNVSKFYRSYILKIVCNSYLYLQNNKSDFLNISNIRIYDHDYTYFGIIMSIFYNGAQFIARIKSNNKEIYIIIKDNFIIKSSNIQNYLLINFLLFG